MQIEIFSRLSLWKKFAATLVLYGFLLLIVTLSISYFTNMRRISSETKEKGGFELIIFSKGSLNLFIELGCFYSLQLKSVVQLISPRSIIPSA
jgi:hypothetical protein